MAPRAYFPFVTTEARFQEVFDTEQGMCFQDAAASGPVLPSLRESSITPVSAHGDQVAEYLAGLDVEHRHLCESQLVRIYGVSLGQIWAGLGAFEMEMTGSDTDEAPPSNGSGDDDNDDDDDDDDDDNDGDDSNDDDIGQPQQKRARRQAAHEGYIVTGTCRTTSPPPSTPTSSTPGGTANALPPQDPASCLDAAETFLRVYDTVACLHLLADRGAASRLVVSLVLAPTLGVQAPRPLVSEELLSRQQVDDAATLSELLFPPTPSSPSASG
ncbi:hypothetical protein B0T24DRAFT_683697 [Lasiosphaeria ovina]|uniref:Uncharacterized protein n=1 Tax=Lasiosphaeria ovina TaxID=92902 RepID=A0AAE0MZ81_9PEZI|nr:hypothetical protein B0T24DRAFT_683697 [Lasiosphaeria ovina]